jgi:hypothetical protein
MKRIAAGLGCAVLSIVAVAAVASPASAYQVRCLGTTAHIYSDSGQYYGYIENSRQC